MAFKVPTYEPQVGIRTLNTAEAPAAQRPPAAAFGGDVAEADQRVGQAVAGLGEKLAQRVVERQQRDQEQEVLAADTEFRKALQGVLSSPEVGADKRPKGLLNRNLGQAKGGTVEFDSSYAELRRSFLESVPTPQQRAALAARMDSHYVSSRDLVVRHESRQGEEDFKSSLDLNLKQRVSDAAAATDPAGLNQAIDEAVRVQAEGGQRLGVKTDGRQLAGDMAKTSISAVLDQDPKRAADLLASVREKLPPDVAASLEQAIDGKKLADERLALWDNLSRERAQFMTLPDGGWDLTAMRGAVLALDVPAEKKEKMWDYVKSRANEDQVIRARADQANDREFFNAAIQAKERGLSFDQALKLSSGFGARDNYDIAQRQEVVKKLWAGPSVTDPQTYVAIWERVQAGGSSKREIDAAFNAGALTPSDYRGLREQFFKAQVEGDNPAAKLAWDRVKNLAEEKFGSDKKSRDGFLYVMQAERTGKKPEELLEIAQQRLSKDPGIGWKGVLQRMDEQSIQRYRQDLGGQLAEPRLNAIQSLAAHGKAVTPESIDTVLKKYPDGVWPK